MNIELFDSSNPWSIRYQQYIVYLPLQSPVGVGLGGTGTGGYGGTGTWHVDPHPV